MIKKPMIILLAMSLLISVAAFDEEQEKLLPSKAYQEMYKAAQEKLADYPAREHAELNEKFLKEFAIEFLPKIATEELSVQEKNYLAMIYNNAGKTKEARVLYKEVASGDDQMAHFAAMLYFGLLAKDETATVDLLKTELEELTKDWEESFQTTYPLNAMKKEYFNKLLETVSADAALNFVNAEVAKLSIETGSPGWTEIPVLYIKTYEALGNRDRGIELAKNCAAKLEEKLQALKKSNENEDERFLSNYNSVVKGLISNINKATLLGRKAPGFTFTHFYNTDPIDFDGLGGKVIVLDFFANWCGPCIGTFPHMREFFAEYTSKGVQVIGVTGFQGSMVNHGSEYVKDLSEEKEAELMHEFIKHQNVTWPVVFSTRNCYDIEYGVRGVPTMVIIDKKGIVRLVTHPYRQKEIRDMVDKLLAE